MTKTKSISIRMTEAEYEAIKAKADNAGVSQGRFMVNAAIADGSLTITDKQKIYQHKVIIQYITKSFIFYKGSIT